MVLNMWLEPTPYLTKIRPHPRAKTALFSEQNRISEPTALAVSTIYTALGTRTHALLCVRWLAYVVSGLVILLSAFLSTIALI